MSRDPYNYNVIFRISFITFLNLLTSFVSGLPINIVTKNAGFMKVITAFQHESTFLQYLYVTSTPSYNMKLIV